VQGARGALSPHAHTRTRKMAPPPPLATVDAFATRLAGLTLNSRPLIDALTASAAELAAASPRGAELVADAVVERASTVRFWSS
jgi:hypothetical protein